MLPISVPRIWYFGRTKCVVPWCSPANLRPRRRWKTHPKRVFRRIDFIYWARNSLGEDLFCNCLPKIKLWWKHCPFLCHGADILGGQNVSSPDAALLNYASNADGKHTQNEFCRIDWYFKRAKRGRGEKKGKERKPYFLENRTLLRERQKREPLITGLVKFRPRAKRGPGREKRKGNRIF